MTAWWDSQPARALVFPLHLEWVHQEQPRFPLCSPFGGGFEDLEGLSQQKRFSKVTF